LLSGWRRGITFVVRPGKYAPAALDSIVDPIRLSKEDLLALGFEQNSLSNRLIHRAGVLLKGRPASQAQDADSGFLPDDLATAVRDHVVAPPAVNRVIDPDDVLVKYGFATPA
jgi:hypothetical protein